MGGAPPVLPGCGGPRRAARWSPLGAARPDTMRIMDQEREECAWCERGLAVLGLMIGGGLAYIALDTLMGGRLTRGLVGGRALASVTPLRTPEEPSA
jgi:hypothetical protein